jgi:pyruvate dehydrogenase E2 component (dihydrolipoamide acetyltransferase)
MPELLRMPEVATGTEEARQLVSGNGRIFASPIARRLAKDAKLDIAQLTGTGPGGRIVRSDVSRAIALQIPPQPATAHPRQPASVPTPTPTPTPTPHIADGWSEVPHTKLRRLIATRLTESKASIPHFHVRGSVRVDRLLKLRAELNEALPVRVSVNDLILKAVAVAHTEVPDANVVWTETGLRQYDSVNLGVAMASPKGLVTPLVAQVERLSIGTLAETTRDLARRASEGQLKQAELEGGTATVSNLGMYGTEEFTAIINPPQSSILAVGAARPEADVTRHGAVKARTKIRVVLSVDHRAIDGALAAQWMSAFRDAVEAPLRLLG